MRESEGKQIGIVVEKRREDRPDFGGNEADLGRKLLMWNAIKRR